MYSLCFYRFLEWILWRRWGFKLVNCYVGLRKREKHAQRTTLRTLRRAQLKEMNRLNETRHVLDEFFEVCWELPGRTWHALGVGVLAELLCSPWKFVHHLGQKEWTTSSSNLAKKHLLCRCHQLFVLPWYTIISLPRSGLSLEPLPFDRLVLLLCWTLGFCAANVHTLVFWGAFTHILYDLHSLFGMIILLTCTRIFGKGERLETS